MPRLPKSPHENAQFRSIAALTETYINGNISDAMHLVAQRPIRALQGARYLRDVLGDEENARAWENACMRRLDQ